MSASLAAELLGGRSVVAAERAVALCDARIVAVAVLRKGVLRIAALVDVHPVVVAIRQHVGLVLVAGLGNHGVVAPADLLDFRDGAEAGDLSDMRIVVGALLVDKGAVAPAGGLGDAGIVQFAVLYQLALAVDRGALGDQTIVVLAGLLGGGAAGRGAGRKVSATL